MSAELAELFDRSIESDRLRYFEMRYQSLSIRSMITRDGRCVSNRSITIKGTNTLFLEPNRPVMATRFKGVPHDSSSLFAHSSQLEFPSCASLPDLYKNPVCMTYAPREPRIADDLIGDLSRTFDSSVFLCERMKYELTFMNTEGVRVHIRTPFEVLTMITKCGSKHRSKLLYSLGKDQDPWESAQKESVASQRESKSVDPARQHTIIFSPISTASLFHEAIGHALEVDNLRATSKGMRPGALRRGQRIMPDGMTICDTPGRKGSSWYLPCDEEGIRKGSDTLVENGTVKNVLHSRRTAFESDSQPTGNGRCYEYDREPIPRQVCLSIADGDATPYELIRDTKCGIYVDSCSSSHLASDGKIFVNVSEARQVIDGETTGSLDGFTVLFPSTIQLGMQVELIANHRELFVFSCLKNQTPVICGVESPSIKIRKCVVGRQADVYAWIRPSMRWKSLYFGKGGDNFE